MNVQVRKSPIHGVGVFAHEDLEDGQYQNVYGAIEPAYPGHPLIVFAIAWDERNIFLPYAPWCFLNHSETPNCYIHCDDEDVANQQLFIIVDGDLPAGTELTIDYGYDPVEGEHNGI